jgi:hypothetical protein
VAAKYILGGMAIAFLALALFRAGSGPQRRTWLIIAIIFGGVSAYLFSQG